MARPKEFDPGEAMKEAMEAFWERGYHATSVNDLLSEMKLNRGSLYGTFGDKKQLFLSALREYEKMGREMMRQALDRPGSPREAIREWMLFVGQTCTGENGLRGCLACKAAMEMAPHDADIAEWVREATRRREQMLARVIRRGQADGEINPRLGARPLARFLMVAMGGLRMMGTSQPTAREVREIIELALRVLD